MCTSCQNVKAFEEFHRRPRNKSGWDSICKSCSNTNQRAWRTRNPDKVKIYTSRHLEKSRQDPIAHSAKIREGHLKKYGLTIESYNKMLESQDGACFTCKKPEPADRALAVNHDHSCCPGESSCGKCVRALLCTKCNQGIGQADERIEILESWIAYLRLHGK